MDFNAKPQSRRDAEGEIIQLYLLSAYIARFSLFCSSADWRLCDLVLKREFRRKTISPILATISSPPKNVWGGSHSPKKMAPITTATSGVTSEIIIALVDSILLNSQ